MNNFISRSRHKKMALIVALGLLLAACGGGGSGIFAGGVGSGGSGVAEGAISGFGSVIVAGVEYDDSNASVMQQNAQGQGEVTEAKLGQRVRIVQSKAGVADTIEVLPQLRGTASSAQDGQGVFQLLGQAVQVISANDTQNTATVLAGLSSVAAGDELEVHGNWVFDSTRNYSLLIATRVEKLSAAPDPVLVSGMVRSRSNNVLTLDSAQALSLQYTALPSSVAAQGLVSAWVPRAALGSTPWVATRLIDASPSIGDNERLLLNTQVSERDLARGEIRVQGIRVQLGSTGSTPPAVGSTVQLEIVRTGNDYKAVALSQRQSGNDLGATVELKGSVLWPANPSQLSLRGSLVNVPNAALASNCSSLQTNDKVYLEITAQRLGQGQALQATKVSCAQQIPGNSVLEVAGTLSQLSEANKTMQLSTRTGTLNLSWSSTTLLPPNLSTWLNRSVEVEYQTVNGENRLRKVKPD